MGRESRFDLQPHSWYPTDRRALYALLPFLAPETLFMEPCAGDGRLVAWLEEAGHRCGYAFDIAPRSKAVYPRDALLPFPPGIYTRTIITNPPYTPRALMHALLGHWLGQRWTCWLLIDAPWMQTGQAAAWLRHCPRIVAAGRMNMFGGDGGKKDHCWFQFLPVATDRAPRFYALGEGPDGPGDFQIPVDDAAVAAGGGPPPAANLVSGEASRPAAHAESG